MILAGLLIAVFCLAWSNGANDNLKGVATLYGSGTCTYRTALVWATAATVLGSLASLVLSRGLLDTFRGDGLLSDALLSPTLFAAVGLAAAATILLATRLGLPTSTTHALAGALVGAALVADPGGVRIATLVRAFAQPLLLSPLVAIALTVPAYWVLHRLRLASGIDRSACLCVEERVQTPVTLTAQGTAAWTTAAAVGVRLTVCHADLHGVRYRGALAGVQAQTAVDWMHYASGAAVCFARAVNDTPKIAALALAGSTLGGPGSLALVTLAMAAGGVLHSRSVARTMSLEITPLNPGQGLTANLVTAALVLGASRLGMPVSTTHVSCGALFGIGLATGRGSGGTILKILAAWVTTLPLALLLGAAAYAGVRAVGA